MLALILFLLLVILVLTIKIVLLRRKTISLSELDVMLIKAYDALDQGMTEQQEAYEQEYLTYDERIKTRDHSIEYMTLIMAEMEAVVTDHNENCLPHVAPRECDG